MDRRAAMGLAGAAVVALGLGGWATAATLKMKPWIVRAISDPGRPKADIERDADRKPAEMLDFAGVQPGTKVAELLPGGGYFTRIFAKAVGPEGHVYAIISPPPANAPNPPPVMAIAADPAYANVTVHPQPLASFSVPEPVDVVWTSQNYHDLHLARYNMDVGAVNKDVFAALKPGGVYIVLDHAAAPGEPVDAADRLHRIDPAIVRREVEAAGFRFEAELGVLRNPADPHNIPVRDPAIRGHTDQFIYKFRKPT